MRKLLLSMLVGLTLTAQAQVKLQPLFSDNMVLQQQTTAPVWGETKANKKVSLTTSWDGKTYHTVTLTFRLPFTTA